MLGHSRLFLKVLELKVYILSCLFISPVARFLSDFLWFEKKRNACQALGWNPGPQIYLQSLFNVWRFCCTEHFTLAYLAWRRNFRRISNAFWLHEHRCPRRFNFAILRFLMKNARKVNFCTCLSHFWKLWAHAGELLRKSVFWWKFLTVIDHTKFRQFRKITHQFLIKISSLSSSQRMKFTASIILVFANAIYLFERTFSTTHLLFFVNNWLRLLFSTIFKITPPEEESISMAKQFSFARLIFQVFKHFTTRKGENIV